MFKIKTILFFNRNIGAGPLAISNLALDASGLFSITSGLSSPILSGASDQFEITLDPAGATEGATITRTVEITNTDADESLFDFPIQVVVTRDVEPEIGIHESDPITGDLLSTSNPMVVFDFGSFPLNAGLGSIITEVFTIRNDGGSQLLVRRIVVESSPAGFTIGTIVDQNHPAGLVPSPTAPAVIAAGQTATFQVLLDTSNQGEFKGVVRVDNNDGDFNEDPFLFNIHSVVADPEINVLHTTQDLTSFLSIVDFGDNPVNTPVIRTLTLDNTGDGDLILGNLDLVPAG